MRNIILVSAMFVFLCATGQNQKDAIKMNDGILPVSIYAGYSNDLWGQGRLSPGYDYHRTEDYSFIVGSEYIFAKTGKFQFVIGAYYKKSSTTGNLFVPSETLGPGQEFRLSFKKEYDFLHIPLKVGFVQKLTPKWFVNLNGGVTYANLFSENMNLENSLSRGGEPVISYRSLDVQQIRGIQFEMGARLIYKSESSGLFGVEFMYHIGDLVASDSILNENIPNEEDHFTSSFWNGKYTSVNLH